MSGTTTILRNVRRHKRMKRKELEKLPVLRATTTMLKQAENEPMIESGYFRKELRYEHEYYARCKRFDRILKVAIYLTKNLAAGGRKPVYELFLDYDAQDFLTYSFMEKKWRTAMLRNLPQQGFGIYDMQISSRDSAVISQYLHSKWGAIVAIREFQEGIREKQLLARHKKETDPWDAAMALVPPLPKDWVRWVSKVGVEQNYMFYQYRRGGAKTGYCSYCDREVPIRNPKHNAVARCPRCRRTVQFKSFGKMGRLRTGRNILYLMQPYPGGFVIREFWAERTYDKEKYRNIKAFYHEFRRAIFNADAKPVQAFYWGVYKQRTSRWIKGCNCSEGYYPDESGRVYGKTIPYLAKTCLQRTGLPELIHANMKTDPEKYLVVLKRMPNLEQLTKAGLFRLAVECTKDYYKLSSIFQTTPVQRGLAPKLGLNRLELARLRKNQGGRAFLEWLQLEKQTGKPISDFAIQWMCKEHIDPQQLQFIADRMRYGQIQHYLNRQMQELNLSSERVIELWRDYLSMAFRFGYDTNDPIVYRVRKLLQRHDELAARGEEKQLTLRAGELLQTYPHIEQNLQAIRKKFAFTGKQFQIQVPDKLEDIFMDSRKLCHCIANSDVYWERMERRESYLLFLRKTAEPDTPYYTVEAEPGGTVRQVRTQYNRQNDDIGEVRAFLKIWQKQLAKRLTQKDKQLAADSHELRIKELVQLRNDQVTIHTGDLAGRLLVDVLTEDLMEAA